MGNILIMRPLTLSGAGGNFTNPTQILTPDPKEVLISPGAGSRIIDISLASAQSVDTLFLGYGSDPSPASISVTYGTVDYTANSWGVINVSNSIRVSDKRYHYLGVLPAPVSARFFRVTITTTLNLSFGVFAVGKSFRPTWNFEVGAGRPIYDTGSVERLFGGGFGINEGVRMSGFQWTLGDLQPTEVDELFALLLDRGVTRSVLVAEDPDAGTGLNERIHWGLMPKIDVYERLSPQDTKYALQIWDWA